MPKDTRSFQRILLPVAMVFSERASSNVEKFHYCQKEDQELIELRDKVIRNEIMRYRVSNGLLLKNVRGEELIIEPRLMQMILIRQISEVGHFASDKTIRQIEDN